MKSITVLINKPWGVSHYICATILILVAALVMRERGVMSDNWIGPYLSAAANLEIGGDFQIYLDEVKQFQDLKPDEQFEYHFQKSNNLVPYNHNPIGYAYLIRAATSIFPVGDMRSVIWLQILVHLVTSIGVLVLLSPPVKKLLFLFFYAANPVVLYIVGMNYYYFWQAIPAMIIIALICCFQREKAFDRSSLIVVGAAFVGIVLGLVFVTRSTVLGHVVFVFALLLIRKETRLLGFVPALLAFLLCVYCIQKPTEKNIWHTVYVGIAAYPNPYIEALSDNEGYALYERTQGEKLNASVGGNYYERDTIRRYQQLTKNKTLEIVKARPLMFVRNFGLNVLQGFTIGYLNEMPFWVHAIMAALGAVIILVLLRFGEWYVIVGCLLGMCCFTPFYPPIPAYMFGNYALLALGASNIVCKLFKLESIQE